MNINVKMRRARLQPLSLGVPFLAAGMLFVASLFGVPAFAYAAGVPLLLYPSVNSARVGSIISVGVFIASPNISINSVSANITFPPSTLEVVSLGMEDSIIDLWVENPAYSNDTGSIKFGGVSFNPGFKDKSGRIMTIRFRVKSTDRAIVRFSSGMVLANDGKGTQLPADITASALFTPGQGPTLAKNDPSSLGDINDSTYGTSQPSTGTGAAEIIIVLLAAAAVITSVYNGYRLRRLEFHETTSNMSPHDEEVFKKLKKDLDMAEFALSRKIGDKEEG